jgi:hypothetical protein
MNSQSLLTIDESGVSITTHRVSFFAIGSITRVFGESDVIGNKYRLTIEQQENDGQKSYSITLA